MDKVAAILVFSFKNSFFRRKGKGQQGGMLTGRIIAIAVNAVGNACNGISLANEKLGKPHSIPVVWI